jgi:glycosyltransferase involved in cell wall biosynthesis
MPDLQPLPPREAGGALVTVITPTIPGREHLLVEACESVARQTLPCDHSVYMDAERHGPARWRAYGVLTMLTPFVAFLDDDDVLYPHHVETLLGVLRESDADLVWSWPRMAGADQTFVPRITDPERLREGRNFIPVTVVARRLALIAAGNFRSDDRFEDYELWLRLQNLNGRMRCFEGVTWEYRLRPGSRTYTG